MDKRSLIFDQSSSCTGWAVLEGGLLVPEAHGVLQPKAGKKAAARVLEMLDDARQLYDFYVPDEVVFECIHYHGLANSGSIQALAWAAFIPCSIASTHFLPAFMVRPQAWKAAVGAQDKEDAKRIVCRFWGIDEEEIITLDHSDALGIAACWSKMAEDYRGGYTKGRINP